MKKLFAITLVIAMAFAMVPGEAFAENTAVHGEISGKSVVAGLTSLIIWPGIGQIINGNENKKVVTHVISGLLVFPRFWSGWDALIDRQGGRWDGKL